MTIHKMTQMRSLIRILIWFISAILGALALGTIALHRGEQINAMWLVVAAFCAYALGYRSAVCGE
jgi:carbon starvation protein